MIQGLIFDLDGTLVDSALNFEAMRREMRLPPGLPILEAIDDLPPDRAKECRQILSRHEQQGLENARLMPGVAEFLAQISRLGYRQAILTRNTNAIARATLERFSLFFDTVFGREDAPAKPDPTAIERIRANWGLEAKQIAMIGDYRFDLEAGHRAGTWKVLYTQGRKPAEISWRDEADFHLECFTQPQDFLRWLQSPRLPE